MRSVELFTGAGGLALGLSESGFRPDLLVEWDRPACRTVMFNVERELPYVKGWPLVCADVRAIDYRDIREGVDLVAGGPPCQPFSIGGKHSGSADERDMWPQAVRAVRELRPTGFIFENVRGLLREAFREYLQYVVLQLSWPQISRKPDELLSDHHRRLHRHHQKNGNAASGYRVEVHPVDAANYGAPQHRRRVIICGVKNEVTAPLIFPAETHSRAALEWDQSVQGTYWERHRVPQRERSYPQRGTGSYPPPGAPWQTVRDAIAGLPDPSAIKAVFPNHRFQPGARSYVGHTGSPLDTPAKALKAGVHGVPGGENMLRRVDGSVRYFTVREAARLQGFPDQYVFPDDVPWSEAMRQLGNAVPVPLAAAVGSAMAGTLRSHLEFKVKRTAA